MASLYKVLKATEFYQLQDLTIADFNLTNVKKFLIIFNNSDIDKFSALSHIPINLKNNSRI